MAGGVFKHTKERLVVAIEPTPKQKISNHRKKRSITINTTLEEKLREIQSQIIHDNKTSFSLSMTVNILIISGLLALDRLGKEDFRKIKYFIDNNKIALDNKKIKNFSTRITKG